MQDITYTIVIGIVTGFLTASVLLLIKSLFVNSFLPWYRQTIYKGTILNSSWYAYLDNQKVLLEITHTCENITGKATAQIIQHNDDDKMNRDDMHIDDIRTFDVTGKIEERFVSLKMHHTNKSRLGIVTYLLQIDGDGTKLKGQSCWYAPLASTINSGETIFFRSDEVAKRDKANKDLRKAPTANKTLREIVDPMGTTISQVKR